MIPDISTFFSWLNNTETGKQIKGILNGKEEISQKMIFKFDALVFRSLKYFQL